MTEPGNDVVEVVATLGDTILEVSHVSSRYDADDFAIEATRDGDGFVIVRGNRETPIAANAPQHVRIGLVDYAIQRVPAPVRSIAHPAIADRRALAYIAASLAVHLAVWGFAGDPDPEPDRIAQERPRKLRLLPAMTDGALPDSRPLARLDSPGMQLDGGGVPIGDGGGGGRLASHARDRTAVDRGRALQQAREAGILGPLSMRPGSLTAITGTGDLARGFAGAQPPRTAEPRGGFGGGGGGWGTTCEPPPGECSFGTVGSGHFSTASYIEQFGGIGGGRAHRTATPSVQMCSAKLCPDAVEGGLDKAIVRRYIQRELHKITYCYEAQLIAEPELGGELTVEFVIATTGAVTTAHGHGVSPAVASCVAGVISRIEFPRSIGETTHVRYPFTLRSTG